MTQSTIVSPSSEFERRIRFEAVAAEVFEPLQRFLRRRANPDEAEEAFSDTLLAIWRRIDDIPDDAVLPWCYGVARRVLANRFRGAWRRRELAAKVIALDPPRAAPDPAAGYDHPELQAALESIRDEDREVLTLWAWEQLEPREIALVLGISDNAAAQRLSKAKKRLSKQMARQDRASAGHRGDEHIGDRP